MRAPDAGTPSAIRDVSHPRAAAQNPGELGRRVILPLPAAESWPYLLASVSLEGRLELSPELAAEIEGDVRYLLPPQRM